MTILVLSTLEEVNIEKLRNMIRNVEKDNIFEFRQQFYEIHEYFVDLTKTCKKFIRDEYTHFVYNTALEFFFQDNFTDYINLVEEIIEINERKKSIFNDHEEEQNFLIETIITVNDALF